MHVLSWKKINEPDIQFKNGERKTRERRKREEIKVNTEFGKIENNQQ